MFPPSALTRTSLRHASVHGPHGSLLAIRLDWHPAANIEDAASDTLLPELIQFLCAPNTRWMLPIATARDLNSPALDSLPSGNWVEFGPELAAEASSRDRLQYLANRGIRLVCHPSPSERHPLSDAVLSGSTLEGDGDLRTGVRRLEQMEKAFQQGAKATMGWPVHNPIGTGSGNGESDIRLVLDILQRIDQGESVDKLEAILERSPTLSFRLMGYLNSAACNLRSEVNSLRHAIMMLGYARLRQWVALLLASSVETPRTRPLMQASVRRAFLLQKIAACQGSLDDHGDLFLCGAFSLLDQMLGKPMEALLDPMPITAEVKDALVRREGPLAPYLELARVLESDSPVDMAASFEATATTQREVNLALLEALNTAFASG